MRSFKKYNILSFSHLRLLSFLCNSPVPFFLSFFKFSSPPIGACTRSKSVVSTGAFIAFHLFTQKNNNNKKKTITEPTTDSAILSTVKTLIENQTLAIHQTLQQYMSTVDSRFDELRSQINGSVGASVGSSRPTVPEPTSSHVLSGVPDISHLLRSMKMDVPKFDGTDPNGWDFRINEFFDFHGTHDHLRLRIVSFHMVGKAAA